jgi:AraC family transcriptional regulator of adaptative response/methylated-DNA-[protein]-cysteine methyltransferase
MDGPTLPARDIMVEAFLDRDSSFEGVFFTAVLTTGIFCRPTCGARKPHPEHVSFYPSARDALQAGFRPCMRCRPLEPRGATPVWLRGLIREVEAQPERKWTDGDLRSRGLSPDRVRRWFQTQHGMTFHAYSRARRLGVALGQIQRGDNVTQAAFAHGYDSLSGFNDAFRQLLGTSPGAARDSAVVKVNRIPTPLGPMIVGGTEEALYILEFSDRRMLETQLERLQRRLGCVLVPGETAATRTTEEQVAAYFEGRLREFSIPTESPGTEFQQAVWERLREIPYGRTASYGEIARRIGQPAAVRAVARANGDNRIAIIIPCHRVIGSDGKLTGYGGGLWRKQRLLELEAGQTVIA